SSEASGWPRSARSCSSLRRATSLRSHSYLPSAATKPVPRCRRGYEMNTMKRSFETSRLAALLLAATLSGCSLLVKFDDECTVDADCAGKGANLMCIDHLCVLPGGADGGSNLGDGGQSCDGATFDPHAMGCFSCPATTNLAFLNACTGSMCQPFDDSK